MGAGVLCCVFACLLGPQVLAFGLRPGVSQSPGWSLHVLWAGPLSSCGPPGGRSRVGAGVRAPGAVTGVAGGT